MNKKEIKFKETEIGEIPEDWEVEELQKISKVIDSCHKTPKYSPEGIAMVRVTDIKYGDIDLKDTLKVTKEVYEEFTLNHKPKKNDIVMSRVGTYGVTSFVNTAELCCLGQNTVIIHPLINSRFIYYALNSRLVRNQIEEEVVGSTQKTISLKNIRELLIAHPNNSIELDKIIKILSSLDSKIELNQAMNKTLESIGQALFKHWFINFEFPNEKGKPYKSSGGEMVESELGEIPKGWKVGKLGECGTFKNGINYLRDEIGDTEFFIANVRDIANNKLLLKDSLDKIKIDLDKAKDYLLNDKDILIARSASPGEISLVLGNLDNVIYSGFSIRYRLNTPDNYLYLFLVLQRLRENLLNFSIGTTLQSVNQETLKNMGLILPSDDILNKFNKTIERILDKTYGNLMQIQNLSQIRDSLLPKLMSGKLRVQINE